MPNERVLKEKQEMVEQLAQSLSETAAGVFVDYRGLTVEEDTQLRNQFRQLGVQYNVIKNSTIRFAIKKCGLEEIEPILHGPTALATHATDLVAPAKVIAEFAKKNENLKIKSGYVEGKVISIEEINKLATLPSKEELIAKVLGGMNSPIAGFANVLNANITGLVRVLNAIAQKSA